MVGYEAMRRGQRRRGRRMAMVRVWFGWLRGGKGMFAGIIPLCGLAGRG